MTRSNPTDRADRCRADRVTLALLLTCIEILENPAADWPWKLAGVRGQVCTWLTWRSLAGGAR